MTELDTDTERAKPVVDQSGRLQAFYVAWFQVCDTRTKDERRSAIQTARDTAEARPFDEGGEDG